MLIDGEPHHACAEHRAADFAEAQRALAANLSEHAAATADPEFARAAAHVVALSAGEAYAGPVVSHAGSAQRAPSIGSARACTSGAAAQCVKTLLRLGLVWGASFVPRRTAGRALQGSVTRSL